MINYPGVDFYFIVTSLLLIINLTISFLFTFDVNPIIFIPFILFT